MSTPKFFHALAGLVMIFAGTGCGNDATTQPGPAPKTADVLFLNAAPAAPSIDLTMGGTALVTGRAFGMPGEYLKIDAGTLNAKAVPTGGAGAVEEQFTLAENGHYTLFAVNDTSNSFDLVLFRDDLATPPAGKAAIRIANLIPDTPPIKFAFAGSGQGPIFNDVDFKEVTEQFIVVNAQDVTMRAINTNPVGTGNGNGTGGGNKVKHSVADLPITLGSGKIYTIALVGRLADSSARMVVITHPAFTGQTGNPL